MSDITPFRATITDGGGAFELADLTVGVFLTAQPEHQLSLGSDKRQTHPLAAQEGWVMPAKSSGMCEFSKPLEVLTVSFSRSLLKEVGLDDPSSIAPHIGAFDPLAHQLLLQTETFLSGEALYRETMSRALASHLVQQLKPAAPAPADTLLTDDPRLKRAISFIHDRLSDEISLEDLAGLAAMSPYHFARSFKAAMGVSPLQYVITARLDKAKLLLKTTKLGLAEIGYRIGYEDPARFSKQFKAKIGVTPGKYRSG